ncbi:MAG: Crp/Fnr family transcriptional regulator [Oscillospiraceae bacterium]|nr:Crp/Fnr family transcriptional regulator [Oscillospiraceae bacterium]
MRHFAPTTEDQAVLNGFFLLQGLPPDLTAWILADSRCHIDVYTRGEAIYDPTHFDRALGLVLSGKIEAAQHADGRPLTLRLHKTGDVFGAAALFAETSDYPARLTALTQTRVLFFEESLLRDLMAKDAKAAENYIAFLAGRIQFLNHRIQSLTAGNAEALLGNFLLNQAPTDNTITPDIGMAPLARRLGISRASLYRAFDALEQRGYIQKTGKTITILNRDGLQNL